MTRDSRTQNSEKPTSTMEATASAATQDCVAFKLSIVFFWIIQCVMETAAFFAAQRRIDD